MYTVEKRDRVQELTGVPLPSSSGPDPLVLADERTLVVTYTAADGSGAMVVFRQCYASHFGLPNDAAFSSHPLAEGGLRPYGAFELERSSWVRGLEIRNRGNPRHDPQLFQQLRHWVWTFHDSVLECAALSYAALEAPGHPDGRLSGMRALLGSS